MKETHERFVTRKQASAKQRELVAAEGREEDEEDEAHHYWDPADGVRKKASDADWDPDSSVTLIKYDSGAYFVPTGL